jgi:hypothetical protein
MKMFVSAALAGAVLLAAPASAATLVQYNFTGAPGNQLFTAATNVATGVTGLNFTRGAGLGTPSGGDSINSNGFNAQSTDYLSFGFNVAAGFTASVDQLLLGTRSSGTGPRNLILQASIDGGAFNQITTFTQLNDNEVFRNLTFGAITALSSLEFRIVASGTTSANGGALAPGGTFRVQNYESGATNTPFSINGNVARVTAAVPEPATWAMMIVGFGVAGSAMRRRKVRVAFAA